jgi:cyclopropane-fatty-acyl-phospholipid synthase
MNNNKAHPLGVPDSKTVNRRAGDEYPVSVTAFERWLAKLILHYAGNPRIAITLWNGETVHSRHGPAVARMKIHDRKSLFDLVRSPHVAAGDGYSAGSIEIIGDLSEFLTEVYRAQNRLRSNGSPVRKLWPSGKRIRQNTQLRARDNIHHHYDLGNDFYRLWLDERMLYTCAYYEHPDATLEEAQLAKMDHVCRKLQLKPGQTVVDAGAGWGALALHMAQHYGVTVKAYNVSHEQVVYARAWAERSGLSDRVEFVESDYRNITGEFDVFVSVGMLEHVGPERYAQLGTVIKRCLKNSGRGLIHTIGRQNSQPMNAWITKRIFPGGYSPTLAEMSPVFEPNNFSILDVENLRLHYGKTCRAWLDRFDKNTGQIESMFGAKLVRAWRLYLTGSAVAFEVGTLQLFQIVFSPPGNNDVPWTRDHLYAAHAMRS